MGFGSIVQHGKRCAVCARICNRPWIGRPAFESTKENAFTHSLRRPTMNEQDTIPRLDWCGDRHSRSTEMRYEIRFGLNVRNTACAVMGKAKHVPLVSVGNNQIHVIEAAIQHSATKRKSKRVSFG